MVMVKCSRVTYYQIRINALIHVLGKSNSCGIIPSYLLDDGRGAHGSSLRQHHTDSMVNSCPYHRQCICMCIQICSWNSDLTVLYFSILLYAHISDAPNTIQRTATAQYAAVMQ